MPIYQFTPYRTPVVSYQGLMPVHARIVGPPSQPPTYGDRLREARLESRSKSGLVCLEHDIAVPCEAWRELGESIAEYPAIVWTVPYVLYPASTLRPCAVWSDRLRDCDGSYTFVPLPNGPPPYPAAFGLGCTYLPGALIDAMPDDLRQWDYPRLDTMLSELARDRSIRCRATSVHAVHMHY